MELEGLRQCFPVFSSDWICVPPSGAKSPAQAGSADMLPKVETESLGLSRSYGEHRRMSRTMQALWKWHEQVAVEVRASRQKKVRKLSLLRASVKDNGGSVELVASAGICNADLSREAAPQLKMMDYSYDEDLDEMCPVCGDKVSGYHYGLLTCESCKGDVSSISAAFQPLHRLVLKSQFTNLFPSSVERLRSVTDTFVTEVIKITPKAAQNVYVPVRADRMRGGRNKFGPMYKRDRALKQQKKALIRANGLKIEAMTQVMQAVPTDLTISSAIQNIHSAASKGLPLSHHPGHHTGHHHHHHHHATALPPTDYDRSPFVTSPVSMAMPPHAGSLQGYQAAYGHFQGTRTIKSEYPDPYTSSPESIMGYAYVDAYQTGSPPSFPHLIVELLKCEPDEPQVQAKIMAYLQQEQASRGKHEKLNTFGLMCKMADQTLFSIVEWARSSIFFRELK
ncbi:hypothetical protein FQN60_012847, partial [Etheostoma spectabile]